MYRNKLLQILVAQLAAEITVPEEIYSHQYHKFKKIALNHLQTRVLKNKLNPYYC